MKYKGYTIKKNRSDNYVVTTPDGTSWAEQAVNLKTAKKWVDADLIERRSKERKAKVNG